MTTLHIRPFDPTDAEYETVLDLVNRAWPDDPASVEHWKDSDSKRNPNYLFQRFVGELPSENGTSKSWQLVPAGSRCGPISRASMALILM